MQKGGGWGCPERGWRGRGSAWKKCNFSTVLRTDNLEEMPLELTPENQKEEARGGESLVEGTEGAQVWRGGQEPYPKATW